jgi:hypothetical protein
MAEQLLASQQGLYSSALVRDVEEEENKFTTDSYKKDEKTEP